MRIFVALSGLTITAMMAITATAQDHMSASFRAGVVEEEASHNLSAAIQDYQTTVAQFDDARQTAATALFRMAECYRKLGKDDQAIPAYTRVVQEFSGQTKLAEQSRAILTAIYHVPSGQAPGNKAQSDARQAYRKALEREVSQTEEKLEVIRLRFRGGVTGAEEVHNAEIDLTKAQAQLAAFDAGILEVAVKK